MASSESHNGAAYDAFGESFARSRKGMSWEEFAPLCSRLREAFPCPRILDVGCGSGRLLDALGKEFPEGFEYFGVDASRVLVSVAKKEYPGRPFAVGDMRDLGSVPELASERFDAVFAVASFHHLLTESDRRTALDSFASVLVPGGLLLMTNWNLLSESNMSKYAKFRDAEGVFRIPFSGKPRAYFAFDRASLECELKRAGWDVLEFSENERNLATVARFRGAGYFESVLPR